MAILSKLVTGEFWEHMCLKKDNATVHTEKDQKCKFCGKTEKQASKKSK